MAYSNGILEEGLKNQVARDYFPSYDCTEIKGRIDFCVHLKAPAGQSELFDRSLYWAEAKKGEANPYESLVQLILTIGKARTYNEYLPPPFLGAFDAQRIAFLPYSDIMEVFHKNDFNWNVAPSNHDTREFKELYALVESTLKAKSLVFYYDKDGAALREFIKKNFYEGVKNVSKITIDKNNFTAIYARWREKVMPTIICDWEEFFGLKIMDADFYLADLLSRDDITIREKLAVLLESNKYKVSNEVLSHGKVKSLFVEGYFNDGMKAHKEFWRIYERPPQQEYWDYIVARRDLLVPQDIRERKGSFYTPQKWVALSQQYIARALGEDWQEKYVVWDPCAGTGNLLAGLTEKYNIYASTIDKQDVDVMHDRITNGANLLDAHVFQFDFLNDGFDSIKVPESLRKVLTDKDKRKHLVVYMNPPYAEADNRKGQGRVGIGVSETQGKYASFMGYARREWYIQFLTRIYKEIPGAVIANFSTLKALQAPRFAEFRQHFTPKLLSLFLIPANTFDNVVGKFPIGFHVWDTAQRETFTEITADVYDKDGVQLAGKKIVPYKSSGLINDWMDTYRHDTDFSIGTMIGVASDFQNQRLVRIEKPFYKVPASNYHWEITADNLIPSGIYFAVRHVIPMAWLNHDDRFLSPNDKWKTNNIFQTDCLAYTLFHGQNRITARNGTNHWIPFTPGEVDAAEKFDSTFMSDFIKPLTFSPSARAVLDAGREVWRYYHAAIRDCFTGSVGGQNRNDGSAGGQPFDRSRDTDNDGGGAGVNASLYDIREYFQGRDDKGRMNAASADTKYTALMARLRGAMDALVGEIEVKVYEYGFLKR